MDSGPRALNGLTPRALNGLTPHPFLCVNWAHYPPHGSNSLPNLIKRLTINAILFHNALIGKKKKPCDSREALNKNIFLQQTYFTAPKPAYRQKGKVPAAIGRLQTKHFLPTGNDITNQNVPIGKHIRKTCDSRARQNK